MDTQTVRNPLVCETTKVTTVGPLQACSRDYGFDYDEEEITCELLAPLPVSLSSQIIDQSGVDEFDFDNLWFLS